MKSVKQTIYVHPYEPSALNKVRGLLNRKIIYPGLFDLFYDLELNSDGLVNIKIAIEDELHEIS